MSLNYGEGSQQPCKHCNEEIGFAIWGNGPRGSWRHTESDTFYCDLFNKETEAEPNAPECNCCIGQWCVDCGTAAQLHEAGVLGFNSTAEDHEFAELLEACAADIAFDERLNRLGEYND